MCAVAHSDPETSFFHACQSIGASVWASVQLWSSKALQPCVCLSTSNRVVELHLAVGSPGKCHVGNKRTAKNMTGQEDACLVASFIQMNVFCVQDLQSRPLKTAFSLKSTWMPKKSCSEADSCRRKWSWCLIPRPSLLALPPAKIIRG